MMVYQWYTPMVLPRFQRLPDPRRAEILAVARRHLARFGEAASYNQIIADAGISKTSAYLYFDGKADLVAEVRRELVERLAALIGPWRATGSVERFWAQLDAQSRTLHEHLVGHPEDLAVLAQRPGPDEAEPFDAWFAGLVDEGVALGVIRADLDRPLIVAATKALFRCLDERGIAALERGEPIDPEPGWQLLRGLWSPTKPRRRR